VELDHKIEHSRSYWNCEISKYTISTYASVRRLPAVASATAGRGGEDQLLGRVGISVV
jgi:hypothetical protein